nr:MAG TPA: hypothetical protein [Caudoviricetes sp.]
MIGQNKGFSTKMTKIWIYCYELSFIVCCIFPIPEYQ